MRVGYRKSGSSSWSQRFFLRNTECLSPTMVLSHSYYFFSQFFLLQFCFNFFAKTHLYPPLSKKTYFSETRLHFFNPNSSDFREFELLGQILGIAIYNEVILDLHFPNIVYKKLLDRAVVREDLNETHPVCESAGELRHCYGKRESEIGFE